MLNRRPRRLLMLWLLTPALAIWLTACAGATTGHRSAGASMGCAEPMDTAAKVKAAPLQRCVTSAQKEIAALIQSDRAASLTQSAELRTSIMTWTALEALRARTVTQDDERRIYGQLRDRQATLLILRRRSPRAALATVEFALAGDAVLLRSLVHDLTHKAFDDSDNRIVNLTDLVVVDDRVAVDDVRDAGRPAATSRGLARGLAAVSRGAELPLPVTPPRDGRLRWAPPPLADPVHLAATTGHSNFKLDDSQDYLISLGQGPVRSQVKIQGGRNVVIIGGEISPALSAPGAYVDGIAIQDQAPNSTVFVEGVRMNGRGLGDAFGIREPSAGTTIVLENIRVDNLRVGNQTGFTTQHPDVIQTGSGPTTLEIDRLTGYTPYQGFFFAPNDPRAGGFKNIPKKAELIDVDLHRSPGLAGITSDMLWQSTPFQLILGNVYIDPGNHPRNLWMWPNAVAWSGVRVGSPPGGNYVPAAVAGDHYRSPGYGS